MEIKLSGCNIKKVLIFSQEKAFFIFQETETPKKNSLYFRKRNFCMFHETGTLNFFFLFQEIEFSELEK